MPKAILTINVGSLVEGVEGEHTTIHIDEKVDFNEKSLPGLTYVKAKINIMKLEDELNIAVENFITKINFICSKCLKPFTHEIKIPFAERQFLFEQPRDIEDLDDLYLVDMKNMTIDLTELFRQEILLHFPLNPLCSLKCKGLCYVCGKDLNKNSCGHASAAAETAKDTHKPMAHLKELFNRAFAEGEHSSIEIKASRLGGTPPNKSSNGETASTKEKSSAKPNKKKI
ncbi:DUF177 domain-containing protein [Candidatus Peregrinibacteria bacterium]|nr:DUF177 domain-containing protein [Candidatus Peregrinibacteria bacterium]